MCTAFVTFITKYFFLLALYMVLFSTSPFPPQSIINRAARLLLKWKLDNVIPHCIANKSALLSSIINQNSFNSLKIPTSSCLVAYNVFFPLFPLQQPHWRCCFSKCLPTQRIFIVVPFACNSLPKIYSCLLPSPSSGLSSVVTISPYSGPLYMT